MVKGNEPRCGKCGYMVRGLATFVCPECGSDLREVGIDTGHTRQPAWVVALVLSISWTVLLLPVRRAMTRALEDAMPRWITVIHTATLQKPTSAAYSSFSIYGSAEARVGVNSATGFSPSNLTAELVTLQGQSSVLTVDLQTERYTYKTIRGATVQPTAALNTSATLDWMKAAGVDTTNPSVAMEAAEFLQSLRERPPQSGGDNWGASTSGPICRHFQYGNDAWSGAGLQKFWPTGLLVLGWVIVWLAGLRWIMGRFAKQ
ncbi:MAG: hypothetical protein JWN24_1057 [Phycisphaerales bacterium]|nr:hypothetical protein [Phycisphaerales bacterium]